MIKKTLLFIIICVLFTNNNNAQNLVFNAGFIANISVTLGNQNKKINTNLSALGALRYGDAALESGASLSIGQLFKRHTINTKGHFYAYDFFTLVGIGKNDNLLGSVASSINSSFIFNNKRSNFKGVGFGVEKEIYPKNKLSVFNNKIGRFIMRFSNNLHAFDISFFNDFKLGKLFNGEGTDFGSTGALRLGYTRITTTQKAYRAGLVLELFTPKPDYSKTPNNILNSDDGRKNVWHTLTPFNSLFYANAFAFGTYQNNLYNIGIKTGINSQKLGAFVQNTLHDGAGLNPRFPWNVTAKDKLFYQINTSIFKSARYEN